MDKYAFFTLNTFRTLTVSTPTLPGGKATPPTCVPRLSCTALTQRTYWGEEGGRQVRLRVDRDSNWRWWAKMSRSRQT
ncbi:hypothetical protein EON65_42755 [archaeon]|nr:MAG: hypothetical protein EON65_42755 [archaeon]